MFTFLLCPTSYAYPLIDLHYNSVYETLNQFAYNILNLVGLTSTLRSGERVEAAS